MKRLFGIVLVLIASGFAFAFQSAPGASQAAQGGARRGAAQTSIPAGKHLVQFDVHTGIGGLGGASNDLILIVFSDRSADSPLVPFPLFGQDIAAEFAFSARDAKPGQTLSFTRLLVDISFLNSKYIRIVNHGTDGWAGESLSLTVDAKRVLDGQRLYPRKGAQQDGGLEKFNGASWNDKNFWEADFQSIRLNK